ncbi:hypothetical protein KY343_03665 [Candidatus Woesearchaeota archaeon]|nr:hypothetical protein [Candidatus Woesearchaeota archaeon]
MQRPILDDLVNKGWKYLSSFGDGLWIMGKPNYYMRRLYDPQTDEVKKEYVNPFKPNKLIPLTPMTCGESYN